MAKAKPDSPWAKPASTAPAMTMPIVAGLSGMRPARRKRRHASAARLNAASRIAVRVVVGVIASGSTLT